MTNKTSANHRFAELVEHLGYTQVALSQLIGISQAYLSQLVSGQRSITTKILQNIAKVRPDINTAWILTGDGEMMIPDNPPGNMVNEDPPQYLQNGNGLLESIIKRLEELERRVDDIEKKHDT